MTLFQFIFKLCGQIRILLQTQYNKCNTYKLIRVYSFSLIYSNGESTSELDKGILLTELKESKSRLCNGDTEITYDEDQKLASCYKHFSSIFKQYYFFLRMKSVAKATFIQKAKAAFQFLHYFVIKCCQFWFENCFLLKLIIWCY